MKKTVTPTSEAEDWPRMGDEEQLGLAKSRQKRLFFEVSREPLGVTGNSLILTQFLSANPTNAVVPYTSILLRCGNSRAIFAVLGFEHGRQT